MYFLMCVMFVAFASVSSEKGGACVTPNGENSTCISIHSCPIIKQALAYLEQDAIDFARNSQCGQESDGPLVCCGLVGRITTPAPPVVTTAPTIKTTPTAATVIDNALLPDASLCGIQSKEIRIVGGKITELDEFPWMVALEYEETNGTPAGFRCSGSLINQKYVLTAAQCLYIRGFNLIGVRLGEWKFSTKEDCVQYTETEKICADPVVDLKITDKLPHPYYSKKSGNNDIALLRLEKEVNYTDFVRPICLPPPNYPEPLPGTRLEISGWGVTENGSRSDVKLKVKIPMAANQECKKVYPNHNHINPNQACAGGEEGKDACNGDSGGPLMTTYIKEDSTEETQWYQEGIIYRGLGCGDKGVPGLYTRVSRYIVWILNNLKEL